MTHAKLIAAWEKKHVYWCAGDLLTPAQKKTLKAFAAAGPLQRRLLEDDLHICLAGMQKHLKTKDFFEFVQIAYRTAEGRDYLEDNWNLLIKTFLTGTDLYLLDDLDGDRLGILHRLATVGTLRIKLKPTRKRGKKRGK
jgi:hypothetical protein